MEKLFYPLVLALGIVFEVAGTVSMKMADGFSKWLPSVMVFVFYGLALGCLVIVLKKMQVSVAYAIWASAGTALIAAYGMVWLKEPTSTMKVISILLIIAGILGLELFD